MKESNVERTHRCNALVKKNKDYKKGDITSIFYGYRFDNPYNEKNGEKKEWWLSHLEHDFDYDTKYMSTICAIEYCPFCGEKLAK